LLAPTYSHRTYDVAGETDLGSPRIVIFEGVNALAVEWRALVDVGVYLDAPVEALRSWFGRRLGALCRAAADAPGTFFHAYAALTDAELEAMAEAVWTSINRPNIEQHIAPTRANADVVVTKRPDHRIDRVRVAGAG
jgi:type I pantothenate kinase